MMEHKLLITMYFKKTNYEESNVAEEKMQSHRSRSQYTENVVNLSLSQCYVRHEEISRSPLS